MSAAVTDTPHIEAQVTLSYRECLHLSWIALKESRIFWTILIVLMVLMRVQALATSGPEDPAAPFWIDLVFWAFLIAILTPLSGLFMWHRSRVFAPMCYRFDADGLEMRSANSELKQRWAAILRIRRRNGFLLLYSGKQHAHVIPRRALPDRDGEATLLRLARLGGVPRIDA